MNRADERSAWAERVETFGPDATLVSGEEAAAKGRALLDSALGGPANVEQALRGRHALGGARARGYRSPTRSFRLTAGLDAKLAAAVETQKRQQSDVIRDALSEYFERHPV